MHEDERTERWLEFSDRCTSGIPGLLPLVLDLPVRFTQAPKADAKRMGIFTNKRGVLRGWELHPEEEARVAELLEATDRCGTDAGAARTQRGRPLTKLQDEARRRRLRAATAANHAVVKGNCLMVMQMLTRREVVRSHFPWQLMMKHCMWMAFQQRRERQGFDEREEDDLILPNACGTS